MMGTLFKQFQHMKWSNQITIDHLHALEKPPVDTLRILSHIICAENVWLCRLTRSIEGLKPWDSLSLEECSEFNELNSDGYAEYLSKLPQEKLDQQISFKLTSGKEMASKISDILCHVPLHGSYHRGQVSHQLSRLDLGSLQVDYFIFSMQ